MRKIKEELDLMMLLRIFRRNYRIMLIVFIVVMLGGVGLIKYKIFNKANEAKSIPINHYIFSIQSKSLMNPLGDTNALLSNRAITQDLNLLKQNIKQTKLDSKAINSIQNMDITIPPSPQTPDIFWINIQADSKAEAQKYADMIIWQIQNSPRAISMKKYLKDIYDVYLQNNPSGKIDFSFLESQIQEALKNGVIIASDLSNKQNGSIEDMVVWTSISSQLTQSKIWIFLIISAIMISIFSAFISDFLKNLRANK